ncbi:Small subunit processome component [Hanseniaspora vineae]
MRQKRAKSYKKQMLVYNHTFKFRDPYQVLLDDQVIIETFKSNFNLIKAICRTLQVLDVKPMITQCCMQKLYETKDQEMISMAKELFERRRCNHNIKEPKEPLDCIYDVVNVNGVNKHRYVVVTQNIDLRRKLRRVPGVPLVHINRSVMVMEPLSDASKEISERQEKQKLTSGLNDAKFAGFVKPEETEDASNNGSAKSGAPLKKRKAPKGPNPLSMKKKQKKVPAHNHESKEKAASSPKDQDSQHVAEKSEEKKSSLAEDSADDAKNDGAVSNRSEVLATDAEGASEKADAPKRKRKRKHKSAKKISGDD